MPLSFDQLFEHSLVLTSREPNFFEQVEHEGDGKYKLKMLEVCENFFLNF